MTAERASRFPLAGLYVILDPSICPARPLVEVLREAADGGARIFQYRNKTAAMKDAYREALMLRDVATEANVVMIVNDRCDLALAVEADGVHLGQHDLPIAQARSLMGPDKLIGISTHTWQQVEAAISGGADYLGFGPIFATKTKHDHETPVGLEQLRSVCARTAVPVFAIGGLDLETIPAVAKAGASGIAVASAVLGAAHVGHAVATMVSCLGAAERPIG